MLDFLVRLTIYFGFGFALQKGKVFSPQVIQDQFAMQDFRMLKMFLSAVATSQLCLALLSVLPMTRQRYQHALRGYLQGHLSRGMVIVGLGASVLGVGMALAGACPGTVAIQLGTGVPHAGWVLLGTIVGGLLHAKLQPQLQRKWYPLARTKPQQQTLPQRLHMSYASLAVAFLLVEAWFVQRILRQHFPSAVTFEHVYQAGFPALLWMKEWPPALAGICVGMLQLPSYLLLWKPLGASTNLEGMCAVLNVVPSLQRLVPAASDLKQLRLVSKAWFARAGALFAMIAGGYTSAILSGTYAAVQGIEQGGWLVMDQHPWTAPVQAFVGGVCILLGARMAGGCTSGHGISGFSFFLLNSMVAVPAMFAAGIAMVTLGMNKSGAGWFQW